MEDPVPTKPPPQPPEYHFHDAPVPNEPPPTLNVVDPPQVGFGLALAKDGPLDWIQAGA
jgi:hypothetical protein